MYSTCRCEYSILFHCDFLQFADEDEGQKCYWTDNCDRSCREDEYVAAESTCMMCSEGKPCHTSGHHRNNKFCCSIPKVGLSIKNIIASLLCGNVEKRCLHSTFSLRQANGYLLWATVQFATYLEVSRVLICAVNKVFLNVIGQKIAVGRAKLVNMLELNRAD